MAVNIVVGSEVPTSVTVPKRYILPLNFQNPSQKTEIQVTITDTTFVLLFNLNTLTNSLFLSSYTINRSINYFLGYQCAWGNYINEIDNGCPYLLYFVDQSNGQNYSKNSVPITYDLLSNGVKLYAELR